MFESDAGEPGQPVLTTADLRALLTRLPGLDVGVPDDERIEQLGLLESLKAAAAGVQARVAVAFDDSQRAQQAARGVPAREQGRGVAAQVALARRESPHQGSRHLGLAKALHLELPHTGGHLASGVVSEWRATLVARETAHLDPDTRRRVDAAVAAELPGWGDRRVVREVRTLAQRLDPTSSAKRAARAAHDRRVTIRPAPDTMTLLTAVLPVAQGVAAYAALDAAAKAAAASGDGRGRGQVMADTLVERLTGQASAAAVPFEVQLVMTDRTLLGGSDEPAQVPGHGPVPAWLTRRLLSGRPDESGGLATGTEATADEAAVWVRRLYASSDGNSLVSMDSRRRRFSGQLRRFLVARDQTCRTPWCDAPIRDGDHAHPSRTGGATDAANGQGLCRACNLAKEAPGWKARTLDPAPAQRHTVETTTPAGHSYQSAAPHPPGWDPWPQPPEEHADAPGARSVLEEWCAALLVA
ncbi:MAG TPA: DUF222 domain-containing protein [Pedococcus sp.]